MSAKQTFSKDELKMPEEHFGAKHHSGEPSYVGIILGILIVVLMCILGGLYLWSEELQKNAAIPETPTTRPSTEENNEPESTTVEAEVETLNVMSTSDELGAIEADLESTNLQEIDADLTAIEAEL